MQKIRITSRKYDGRLRDEYEALLYAEDDERLVVYAPVGTMSYDRHTQAWVGATDGLLEIYFKNRWYNVWHIGAVGIAYGAPYLHAARSLTVTP